MYRRDFIAARPIENLWVWGGCRKEIREALDSIQFDGQIIQEPFVMFGGLVGQDISVWRGL